MASNDWDIIYGDFTDEEIAAQRSKLMEELDNLYLSQSQGGKSYTRSITDVRMRLAALTRVRKSRGGRFDQDATVADFS